jgi:hypothetical protein
MWYNGISVLSIRSPWNRAGLGVVPNGSSNLVDWARQDVSFFFLDFFLFQTAVTAGTKVILFVTNFTFT